MVKSERQALICLRTPVPVQVNPKGTASIGSPILSPEAIVRPREFIAFVELFYKV